MDTIDIPSGFAAGMAAHRAGEGFDPDQPVAWMQGWSYSAGAAAAARGVPLPEPCEGGVCALCGLWREGWIAHASTIAESH